MTFNLNLPSSTGFRDGETIKFNDPRLVALVGEERFNRIILHHLAGYPHQDDEQGWSKLKEGKSSG